MKSVIVLLGATFLLLLARTAEAQWSEDVRLTNMSQQGFTSPGRCLVASGDTLHLVWYDYNQSRWEIYYRRSIDEGATWDAIVRLTDDDVDSFNPTVTALGSDVHVAWGQIIDGVSQTMCMRSTDGGATWGESQRLTMTTSYAGVPALAASGATVHAAWQDARIGGRRIYYTQSTDRGITWADARPMVHPQMSDTSFLVHLSMDGSTVHMMWAEWFGDSIRYMHVRSSGNGSTWQPAVAIATSLIEYKPAPYTAYLAHSLSASNGHVHAVWSDYSAELGRQAFLRSSRDGGISWDAIEQVSVKPDGLVYEPTVTASGGDVHVVWDDRRHGNAEIYHRRWSADEASWSDEMRLTNAPGRSSRAHFALTGRALHVVWYDQRDGNEEIYYKRNETGMLPASIESGSATTVLSRIVPNPFETETTLSFTLSRPAPVSVSVFDASGAMVATLLSGTLPTGHHLVRWNGRDRTGAIVPAGRYLYRIAAGEHQSSGVVVITR